jgi:hypothetical protein
MVFDKRNIQTSFDNMPPLRTAEFARCKIVNKIFVCFIVLFLYKIVSNQEVL